MQYCALILLSFSSVWALPAIEKKPALDITNGNLASQDQFPWVAAVYYDTPDGTYFAQGALIGDQWIVTVGNSTLRATVFTIHLGANSLVSPDDNRVTVATATKITHDDFDPETLENNIGLIKLTNPVELNDHIQAIALDRDEAGDGVKGQVCGWGQTGDWDTGVSNDLLYANLETLTNDACSDTYPGDIYEGNLCAIGNANQATCSNDAGAPLARTVDDVPLLVGLAAWVSPEGCENGDPSVFTRISAYADWIDAKTGLKLK